MKKIMVTGAAGFIGFHYAKRLCKDGHQVMGVDIVNDYYDVTLKENRLKQLEPLDNFEFERTDLADKAALDKLFQTWKPDIVVNLAAQAGVRYSIENPYAYINSNISGFINILEGCRHNNIEHLIYASSSSVYGANTKVPFSVHDNVDHPISLYAATKKSNELMAHTYAHLYGLPCTGLRFFTVYGPWGRPDMAMFIFTKAIYDRKPINIFNHGDMKRDFTYIDDIIESLARLIDHPATPNNDWNSDSPDPGTSKAPYRLYNIGNNNPEDLMHMISVLEAEIGITAEKNMMEMQPGDVPATYADVDTLVKDIDFRPNTSIETGIRNFVRWYRDYHTLGNGPVLVEEQKEA